MLKNSGLFLLLLTIFQVSARMTIVDTDLIENVIQSESDAVSSSSRIVSGWDAQPGQHPHHAALRFVNAVGESRICGGSIVAREWVLTEARCTDNHVLVLVGVGGVYLSNPEYLFESTEWYNHPGYNNLSSSIQQHSISLVKLQRPIVYTRLVNAIRVQSNADAFRDYHGERVYASGHGRTENSDSSEVLRWVYLTAISNTVCSRTSADVYETTICARYYNVISQSACFVRFEALRPIFSLSFQYKGADKLEHSLVTEHRAFAVFIFVELNNEPSQTSIEPNTATNIFTSILVNALVDARQKIFFMKMSDLKMTETNWLGKKFKGDQGGPLVHVENDGVPTLIGVSHYFPNIGCDIGRPTGFIRPGAYQAWFKEVTGLDFENLQEDDTTTTDSTTSTSDSTTTDSTTSTSDSTTTDFTTSTSDSTTTDSTTSTSDSTTTDSTTSTSDSTTTDSTTSTSDSTTIDSTTSTSDSTITDSTSTTTPEEENEEDSESDEDDTLQFLKRLEVKVKVKVSFSKYNVTN